jgi:hypothetical protein
VEEFGSVQGVGAVGDGLALWPGQVFGEGWHCGPQEYRAGVLRRIVHRFGRAPRNTHLRTSRSCPRRGRRRRGPVSLGCRWAP